jgi:3'(2'), 5'-bisphosphate nucleotidase
MIDTNTAEIKFAIHAVRKAAEIIQQIQSEMVIHPKTDLHVTKADLSPVTIADFASQAVIAYFLAETFPSDRLVAEEDSSELRIPQGEGPGVGEEAAAKTQAVPLLEQVTQYVSRFLPQANPSKVSQWIDYGGAEPAGRFWVLDPIDGTKGFLRSDQYAVALALVVDGQVQLGLLGCPNLADAYRPDLEGPGSLVVAVRGQGTWTTPLAQPGSFEQLKVSQRSLPADARLLRSFESGHTNVGQIDSFAQALGIKAEPVRMDSQAKYAVLASGKGELLLRLLSPAKPDYREKIWDQAAGSLVVEEAGGRITDLNGKPLDFTAGRTLARNCGILASNSLLHQAALEGLKAVDA